RLAFGYMEDMFPGAEAEYTLAEAARETRLEAALIERVWSALGIPGQSLEQISEDDLQLLRYVAAVLAAGFPLVALLQLVRVYRPAVPPNPPAEARPLPP